MSLEEPRYTIERTREPTSIPAHATSLSIQVNRTLADIWVQQPGHTQYHICSTMSMGKIGLAQETRSTVSLTLTTLLFPKDAHYQKQFCTYLFTYILKYAQHPPCATHPLIVRGKIEKEIENIKIYYLTLKLPPDGLSIRSAHGITPFSLFQSHPNTSLTITNLPKKIKYRGS